MSDDFLDRARANWRDSDEELEQMANTLRRKYVLSKLAFPMELVGAGIAVGAGVYLMLVDFGPYAVMARLAGAILLVAVPMLTAVSWFVRRAHPVWESETAEGVLRYAGRRLDVVERLVRLARWHALVLAGFVAALWAFALTGQLPMDMMLAGFTVFYLGIAGATYAWTHWRLAKLAREREQVKALLAEFVSEG
jgi:hypothetical protein